MKKCPQCKNIYSDDTLSFCLQDGAPLSSPYDPEATLVLGADDSTVQRTNANYDSEIPTETRFGESRQTSSSIHAVLTSKTSPHIIYAGSGLIAVLVIVGGMIWLNMSSQSAENLLPTGTPSSKNANVTSTTAATPRQETRSVSVDAQYMWTDTLLDVQAGDRLNITATGRATATTTPGDAANKYVGPDGWGFQPQFNNQGKPHRWLQVLGPGSSLECMTGKIGDHGIPFKVGSSLSFTADQSGRLFLGVNHVVSDADGNRLWPNSERGRIWPNSAGSFDARIELNGTHQSSVPKRGERTPTLRELQDTLMKEAQRIEDEARKRDLGR